MANYDFRKQGAGSICWTNTPYTPEALREIPYIEMVGYQQDASAAMTSIERWYGRALDTLNGKGPILDNPYLGLYSGKKTNTYVLPFLNEYHHNITQNWAPNDGPLGDTVKGLYDMIEAAGKAFLPAAGIIYPKSYGGSVPANYTFTFNLINTNTGGGQDTRIHILHNEAFLRQFIEDNLHNMNGSLSVTPPLIYEILIPGVRWSPAAVVSGLTVNNKGTMNLNIGHRYSSIAENYIFPDAWEVTVSITELINESKDIYIDSSPKSGPSNKINTKVFDNEAE
jgi:hypothetical protein